jgi:hypothetical protein
MLKLRVGLLALVVVMSTTVNAQEWPSRLLRFIVPFPAGGSADVGARLVGEYLSRSLQQPSSSRIGPAPTATLASSPRRKARRMATRSWLRAMSSAATRTSTR